MTRNARKISIETERSETLVLRLSGEAAITAFCEVCKAESKMLDLNSAVNYSGRPARMLMREIESGAIHATETASGHLLVCAESLLDVKSPSESAGEE